MLTGSRHAYSLPTPSPIQGLSHLAADVLAQLGELALILLCAIRKAACKLTLHTDNFTHSSNSSAHPKSCLQTHTRTAHTCAVRMSLSLGLAGIESFALSWHLTKHLCMRPCITKQHSTRCPLVTLF